jgi:hypothetical protein
MDRAHGLGRTRVFLFLVFILLGSALLGGSEPQILSGNAALRSYESWQELTQGPYKVPPQVWAGCIPPPAKEYYHPGELVPRDADRFIRVYANPQAQPLMRSPRGPKFPVGSAIAKVKLLPGSHQPVAVAFMIKREAGFAPGSLDWEFLFFEGAPLRRMALGKNERCQECHGNLKRADGVFGSYLAERQGEGMGG